MRRIFGMLLLGAIFYAPVALIFYWLDTHQLP